MVNLGYRVLSAANGEEATKLCEEETPALAILDIGHAPNGRYGHGKTAAQPLSGFAGAVYQRVRGIHGSGGLLFPNSRYLQQPYSPTSRMIRKILDETDRKQAA